MKERREMQKRLHFCTNCGKQDERTLAGHNYCQECEANRRKPTQAQMEQKNQRVRERTQKRIAEGLCTECGKPAWNGLHCCMECSMKKRKQKEKKRREDGKFPKWLWKEMGLCTMCGSSRADKTKAFSGDPVLLCETCFSKCVENLEKGREAYFEKYGITWGEHETRLTLALNELQKAERKILPYKGEIYGRVTP